MPAPSDRTTVRRHPERAHYDRETVLAILDEGLICHLGFIVDGTPYVVPTMYARHEDALYIHGSPASRMLRTAAGGAEVCLTVTLLDGLVLARSVFSHSMNYRSVLVLGRPVEVTDPAEKMFASQELVEHVCRGRWAHARHPSTKELAATVVLKLRISECSAKVRSGGPKDQEDDLSLPIWAGVIPLRVAPQAPVSDEPMPHPVPIPAYVTRYTRPGWSA